MNRRIALGVVGCLGAVAVACGGSTGPTGPAGQTGQTGATGPSGSSSSGGSGTASVSGIEPATAFLARQTHVTISGYATSWTDKTTIDFGPGITAANIHAASPTALVADLTIAKTAALGPRDVVINDTTKETYSQGFIIAPPATLTLQGSLAQGSIAFANLQLEDQSTPFDTTGTQDPLSGAITYTNLAFTVPNGVTSSINAATTNSVQILLTVDVDATAGAADLDLMSGPAGATTDVEFPIPGGLTVTAQTATALGTTPASGNVKTAYASTLYSYTPGAALSIDDITASSSVTGANAGFALLPKSGHFADIVGFFQAAAGTSTSATTTLLTSSTDLYYAIYWDNSGATGAYTLGATGTAPAASHATTATDGTKQGAVVATALPFVLTGGVLTTATSADWVKVTTGTGDAGKAIHVQTFGDPLTDLAVSIVASDGTTSFLAAVETGGAVDTTSPAVAAMTTYYVIFAAGQLGFDPADGSYEGLVRVQ